MGQPDSSPPAGAAWLAFALLSVALFGNYYAYDAVGPVADMLQKQLGFSDSQIGALNAVYSLPNIFLVLLGGILVDRFGAGRAIFALAVVCVAGAVLTAAANDFRTMLAGRFLFGVGAESMIVAITVAIAQWFRSATLGLAMGLNLSFGRLGSYGADLSPTLAAPLYAEGWRGPLELAAGFTVLAAIASGLFWWLERRTRAGHALLASQPAERFVLADAWRFGRAFWWIVALCVAFYSVIFPFRSTFAIKYFQHVHGLALDAASLMNGHVFLAAIIATPMFGYLADRTGRREALLLFGAALLPLSFAVMAATGWHLWVATVLIGISFSLVPAVLWPTVTRLVEPRRFGTAFGLMTMLQNAGMMAGNLVAGVLNDANRASAANPGGYDGMLWFFGVLATVGFGFAFLLWRDRRLP